MAPPPSDIVLEYLNVGDDLKAAEKNIKNKFRWPWFDERINVKLPGGGDEITIKVGDTLKKLKHPGKVYCGLCLCAVSYGTEGN